MMLLLSIFKKTNKLGADNRLPQIMNPRDFTPQSTVSVLFSDLLTGVF